MEAKKATDLANACKYCKHDLDEGFSRKLDDDDRIEVKCAWCSELNYVPHAVWLNIMAKDKAIEQKNPSQSKDQEIDMASDSEVESAETTFHVDKVKAAAKEARR